MNKRRMVVFNILRGLAAIILALAVAAIFIFLASDEPFEALKQLLIAPLVNFRGESAAFNVQSLYQILALMIPTMFTGLGVCVMFSADMFNLGGEGAVMAGGFVASLIAIYVPMPAGVHPVVAVLVGTLVGGLVTLIPALLRVKVGASEMVSSLMFNYVVMYIIMHYLNNVFADRSKGSTQSFPFIETAKIPQLVTGGSRLTYGFLIALVFVVITAIFMYRTRWGYQVRMIGVNPNFAKYSGMNVASTLILAQFIGGLLSGMGGAIEVLGRYNTFLWKELPGYGWTGITIAILARNNPAFVPFAAFFLAYLDRGCQLMSTHSDVPSEMIAIIQAAIFLFFAAEQFLSGARQKLVVKNAQDELAAMEAKTVQEGK